MKLQSQLEASFAMIFEFGSISRDIVPNSRHAIFKMKLINSYFVRMITSLAISFLALKEMHLSQQRMIRLYKSFGENSV